MGWLEKLFGSEPREAPAPAPPPAPSLPDPDFVVIDVETACTSVASICQIGIVGFRGGVESFSYETLVDPREAFDDFNTRLHGIASSHVRGKPHFGLVHGTVSQHLGGRVTVAHSSFDRGALAAACAAHRRPEIKTRWLDSVSVARRAWPDLENHKLGTLADYLGLQHRHHDALSDARAAGMVIIKAIDHTGIGLEEWLQPAPRRHPAPSPSLKRAGGETGPLAGEYVCMTGDFALSKSDMADLIAGAGGGVSPSVTRKTTILVLGAQDPSTFAGKLKSSKHLKAEEAMASGQSIRIMDEADFAALLRTGG